MVQATTEPAGSSVRSTEQAMCCSKKKTLRERWRHRSWPKIYHVPGYGLAYRTVNRVSHRFNWHHTHRLGPMIEDGRIFERCDWCGISRTVYDPAWEKYLARVTSNGDRDVAAESAGDSLNQPTPHSSSLSQGE